MPITKYEERYKEVKENLVEVLNAIDLEIKKLLSMIDLPRSEDFTVQLGMVDDQFKRANALIDMADTLVPIINQHNRQGNMGDVGGIEDLVKRRDVEYRLYSSLRQKLTSQD